MENSFINFRTKILQCLVNNTAPIYMKLTKGNKKPWKYNKDNLRQFPTGSLGKELSLFLDKNKIDLIPKAERHDVFHVLTGYDINPEEETMMQFWLLGNRKWTPYTIGTCIIGFILIPEHWKSFLNSFKKGMKAPAIYDWDFESMLYLNINPILSQVHATSPFLMYKNY